MAGIKPQQDENADDQTIRRVAYISMDFDFLNAGDFTVDERQAYRQFIEIQALTECAEIPSTSNPPDL